jgi:branched-chain amino acid aminotransferase
MILDYPAYHNGSFCKVRDLQVSILDLGFIHSDATYDVIAIKDGEFVNLDAHLTRFKKSCEGWRIPLQYTVEDLEAILRVLHVKVPLDIKDCLVWIAVTRGIPTSGNPRDLASCEPNFYAYIKPYFGFNSSNSATVCLAKQKRNDAIDQTMKNFAWNDLNLAQWEAIDRGYDTAILVDRRGYVTEGPGFNVGMIQGDTVYAPESNRLSGTVMEFVRYRCVKEGLSFKYSDIKPEVFLHYADAMFLTSTAGNVITVTEFEDRTFHDNEILTWLKNVI